MIILDNRESYLIDYFKKENQSHQTDSLFLGDVHIKDTSNNIIYIIERKTLSDLKSSFQDGRYKNQKYKLSDYLTTHPTTKIIYLIEHDYQTRSFSTSNLIYSSIHEHFTPKHFIGFYHSILHHNFNYLFTASLDETFLFLKLINEKIESTSVKSDVDHPLVKITHKKFNNPTVCFINQLTCIDGISITIANGIATHYSSIHEMVNEYNKYRTDIIKKKYLFRDLKLNNRKLGDHLSVNLYKFLHSKKSIVISRKNNTRSNTIIQTTTQCKSRDFNDTKLTNKSQSRYKKYTPKKIQFSLNDD
jgi:ERCC4-type nuclease